MANNPGDIQTSSIIGHRVILGVETAVRHEVLVEDGGGSQVFENFWTAGPDGDLYLHGAVNYTHPAEIVYSPPVLMLDGPLELGRAWVTSGILTYDLEGNPLSTTPFDLGLAVYSSGDVVVPAGTFYTYGVGFHFGSSTLAGLMDQGYDLFGRRLSGSASAASREARDWYAEEVGLVQHGSEGSPEMMMKLVAWAPSAVHAAHWGRIKALFR
jgi:hypothetical protein